MAGILEKTRTLVLSNVHSLLDKLIDLNSTEAVKQHIRDLEMAITKLETAVSEALGGVRTATREKNELEARAKELDHTIDVILTDGDPNNDHLATAKQVELDGVQKNLVAKIDELHEAKETSQKLEEVLGTLRAKHAEMVTRLRALENLERATKAKASAAKAIGMVQQMVANGEAVSVDNVMERMRRQADVADVKLERAMSTFGETAGKDVAIAEAQAKIEERKKKLAAEKNLDSK